MNNSLKEKYWAVRLGRPGKDRPYLLVDDFNKEAPGLYATKKSAAKHLLPDPGCKVVRVEVRQIQL